MLGSRQVGFGQNAPKAPRSSARWIASGLVPTIGTRVLEPARAPTASVHRAARSHLPQVYRLLGVRPLVRLRVSAARSTTGRLS
jgi:hypothetical protein